MENLFIEKTEITDRSILKKEEGKAIHVEYNINPIRDDKGGFSGIQIVFKDITPQLKDEESLKEQEKKFRAIFYQSMLATEIFDAKGKFLDANPACIRLFGAKDTTQLKQFNLFKDYKLKPQEIENLKLNYHN